MILFGKQIAGRLIAMVVAAILLIAIAGFALNQCQKRRSAAAQARVDRSQAEAASESARDAIGTVTRRGAEETASEQLTRDNERDIRAAEGANDRVNMGVHSTGLRALCKRDAYKHTPRCKIYRGEGQ